MVELRIPKIYFVHISLWNFPTLLKGALDDTTTISWTSDSKIVAVGGKDNTTRLYPVREKYSNFHSYTLGGHSDPVMGTFFQENSLGEFSLTNAI